MRRQKTCVRGSYLLEAAIVTFGLAVFLVGASDVARIFHARVLRVSAVRCRGHIVDSIVAHFDEESSTGNGLRGIGPAWKRPECGAMLSQSVGV